MSYHQSIVVDLSMVAQTSDGLTAWRDPSIAHT